MKTKVGLFLCLIILSGSALGYGKDGHKAIAYYAQQHLSTKTAKAVKKLLGNTNLVNVAVWADGLRDDPAHTPDASRVNHDLPGNDKWHFVNLPLDSTSYDLNSRFARNDDVVHSIRRCIAVLEGPATSGPMTKKDALRFLVHLVGDVHQPVHVSCGYYTFASDGTPTLYTDPATVPVNAEHDRGGNKLHYGSQNLHSLWDTPLVQMIGSSYQAIAQAIDPIIQSNAAVWDNTGDYHSWPMAWASDAVEPARNAYSDVQMGKAVWHSNPGGAWDSINVTLQPSNAGYKQNHLDAEKDQVAKGAYHLARLLNSIKWKTP